MSLLGALSSARSGIIATQAAIDVASRNIANASVDGYTRKIQEVSTRVIDGRVGAVRTEEVTRNVSEQLQRDVRDQTTVVEELKIIEDFLARLELQFGRPEDSSSVASKITALKESFQVLATNPDLAIAQQDVLRAAEEVALSLNNLSASIQDLRKEADNRINDSVDSVNETLQNIEALNRDIGARKSVGESTADLEDQRDELVLSLAEQMNVSTLERPDGKLAVLVSGTSNFLVDQTASTLSFSTTGVVAADTALNNIQLDNGFLAPFSITTDVTSGELGGLLQLRDTILPLAQDQIDSLAFELAQQFDEIAISPNFGADIELFVNGAGNVPTGAGSDQGFSAQIQVNSLVTTTPTILRDGGVTPASTALVAAGGAYTATGVSDSTVPLAIIGMFETQQAFVAVTGLNSTSSRIEEFAAEFIGYQANQKADFESQLNFQEQIRGLLDERLRDESGVNIDEELASLIQLETAFSASARVLTSVQSALDELLGVLR